MPIYNELPRGVSLSSFDWSRFISYAHIVRGSNQDTPNLSGLIVGHKYLFIFTGLNTSGSAIDFSTRTMNPKGFNIELRTYYGDGQHNSQQRPFGGMFVGTAISTTGSLDLSGYDGSSRWTYMYFDLNEISGLVGSIGGDNETVLWENSNPSASFGNQNITLAGNISQYERMRIYYRPTSDLTEVHWLDYEITAGTSSSASGRFGPIVWDGSNNYARSICFNGSNINQLIVDNAQQMGGTGTSNNLIVPLRVCGIVSYLDMVDTGNLLTQSKIVTPSSEVQIITPDEGYLLSSVTVNAQVPVLNKVTFNNLGYNSSSTQYSSVLDTGEDKVTCHYMFAGGGSYGCTIGIQGSDNNSSWTTLRSTSNSDNRQITLSGTYNTYRYYRAYATATRATVTVSYGGMLACAN